MEGNLIGLKLPDHQMTLNRSLLDSLKNQTCCDVSFITEDGSILQAHRLVLSAFSPHLKNLFDRCPTPSPTLAVVLPNVSFSELNTFLLFLYSGETYGDGDRIKAVMKVAKFLGVKGFPQAEKRNDETPPNSNSLKHRKLSRSVSFNALSASSPTEDEGRLMIVEESPQASPRQPCSPISIKQEITVEDDQEITVYSLRTTSPCSSGYCSSAPNSQELAASQEYARCVSPPDNAPSYLEQQMAVILGEEHEQNEAGGSRGGGSEMVVGHSQQVQHSNGVITNIPEMVNWPGEYGFDLDFEVPIVRVAKATSATYSEVTDTLFINMDHPHVFRFYCKNSNRMPSDLYIRALPVFSKTEDIQNVVRRCANHCDTAHPTNKGFLFPAHLIRCDNPLARYDQNPTTQRLSVVVPYQQPQPGTAYTLYMFRFMCLNSCPGWLERKPMKIVFSLEDGSGTIFGRRSIGIRICACPGRDRIAQEKRYIHNLEKGLANDHITDSSKPVQYYLPTTPKEYVPLKQNHGKNNASSERGPRIRHPNEPPRKMFRTQPAILKIAGKQHPTYESAVSIGCLPWETKPPE